MKTDWKYRCFTWLNRKFGYEIWNYKSGFPPDFDPTVIDTILAVASFTTTSRERLFALCKAVEYVVQNEIPGDIVECGVWRGGSMMAVAHTLLRLQDTSRHLYLFDTFAGMPEPGEKDISFRDEEAAITWRKLARGDINKWCYAPFGEVGKNMNSVGYDSGKIHLVKGKVEETIPAEAPRTISLLRLDTDWYATYRHELTHLFPRVSHGGVLIVDDYGHWKGARQATDEYVKEHKIKLLLNRIDYTARIGVKI